jgi:hypothetical protein
MYHVCTKSIKVIRTLLQTKLRKQTQHSLFYGRSSVTCCLARKRRMFVTLVVRHTNKEQKLTGDSCLCVLLKQTLILNKKNIQS